MDPEDLWDAHQCVLDWRDSDNCDDTPANRQRLLALANRLKKAANAATAATPRVGLDDDGTLDDFMARHVWMVHFEALDDAQWYANVQLVNGEVWQLNFGAKNAHAKGYARAEPQGNFPIQQPT